MSNVFQGAIFAALLQLPPKRTVMATSIPELGVVSTHKDASLSPNNDQHHRKSTCSSSHQHTANADDREVHVYAHPDDVLDEQAAGSGEEVMLQVNLLYNQE